MWRNWYLRCRDIASIKRCLILWPFTVYYGKSGVRFRGQHYPTPEWFMGSGLTPLWSAFRINLATWLKRTSTGASSKSG